MTWRLHNLLSSCKKDLKYLHHLLLVSCLLLISAQSSYTPRGVALSRAPLYDPQKDFSCLDGSKLIPFSRVNDDYCDCKDGSDEPGTAACSKGSFFCLNAGHVSSYLRASRVDDGVCDCCDGSDESSLNCPHTCSALGKAAREEEERKSKLIREGYQKRIELSKAGKEIRKQKEDERSQLEQERLKAENVKVEKGDIKELAEGPEKAALDKYKEQEEEKQKLVEEEESRNSETDAEAIFNMLDSNSDGVLTIEEMRTRQTFDKDKDGVVTEEEAMFFLNMETEMGREDFIKTGYSIAKPFFLLEEGMFKPPEEGDEQQQQQQEEEDNQEHQHEYEDDEADDLRENEDDVGETSHEEPPPPQIQEEKYDEITRFLIAEADRARAEYNEADKVLRDITQKLQEVNDVLNLDFGDDERFAAVWGQCYEFEDREYVYSLCPFGEATQRPKSGGSSLNLGKWAHWSGPEPPSKYTEMLYSNGQGCWNGPSRSARVSLSCGLEHRITGVSEPSRCEYHIDFTTPTACEKIDVQQQAGHEPPHDEL